MKNMDDMKFAERFEFAVAEFAILNKALQTNDVTPENVMGSLPKGNVNINRDVVNQGFDRLVQDGHLQKQGNKYTITDDGREDVQKLQVIVLELPQMIQSRGNVPGQQQRPGVQQATGTGGSYSGSGQQGMRSGQQGGNIGGSGPQGGNPPGRR